MLIKIVVITSMVVRFTLRAASMKVISISRREGKKVVIISDIIVLFSLTFILTPSFLLLVLAKTIAWSIMRKRVMSAACFMVRMLGTKVTVSRSRVAVIMLIEHT